ncbi:MAG: ATP synthase subunit C [Candidatus Odinarchaeota archaeon]
MSRLSSLKLKKAVLGLTIIVPAIIMLLSLVTIAPAISVTAATASLTGTAQDGTAVDQNAGLIALGAALAIGITGVGASLGLGSAASAAIAAITEKEEVFGKALIFVVLIEGIAIFGFLIALQIVPSIAAALGE